MRLFVAQSQHGEGSTTTVDFWPELPMDKSSVGLAGKGRGNGRERVVIFGYGGDRSFSSEASRNFYRWVAIQVKPAHGSLLISRVKFH